MLSFKVMMLLLFGIFSSFILALNRIEISLDRRFYHMVVSYRMTSNWMHIKLARCKMCVFCIASYDPIDRSYAEYCHVGNLLDDLKNES